MNISEAINELAQVNNVRKDLKSKNKIIHDQMNIIKNLERYMNEVVQDLNLRIRLLVNDPYVDDIDTAIIEGFQRNGGWKQVLIDSGLYVNEGESNVSTINS